MKDTLYSALWQRLEAKIKTTPNLVYCHASFSDDDLESGYLSPESDSSKSQTQRLQNVHNLRMLENKVRGMSVYCVTCE